MVKVDRDMTPVLKVCVTIRVAWSCRNGDGDGIGRGQSYANQSLKQTYAAVDVANHSPITGTDLSRYCHRHHCGIRRSIQLICPVSTVLHCTLYNHSDSHAEFSHQCMTLKPSKSVPVSPHNLYISIKSQSNMFY